LRDFIDFDLDGNIDSIKSLIDFGHASGPVTVTIACESFKRVFGLVGEDVLSNALQKQLTSSVICVPSGSCVILKEIWCMKFASRRAPETGVSFLTKSRDWTLPRFFHLPSQPMKSFHCTLAVVPFKKPT
jgi:hypothetical protein